MISIDIKTGTFTWGNTTIDIFLSLDDLMKRKPEMYISRQVYDGHGNLWTTCHLPSIQTDQLKWCMSLYFHREHLSSIGLFSYEDWRLNNEDDDEIDDSPRAYWDRQLEWVKAVKDWLSMQLGQPDRSSSAFIEAEDIDVSLSDDEQELLGGWHYKLPWGEVNFDCAPYEYIPGIGIRYDADYKQVPDWDALLREYDRSIEIDLMLGGRDVVSLQTGRQLAQLIREHFDYDLAKPWMWGHGVGFRPAYPRRWRPYFTVSIEPNSDKGKYVVFDVEAYKYEYMDDLSEAIAKLKELLS